MANDRLNVTDTALDLLLTRRSQVAAKMVAPGPSAEELKKIIQAGLRVPDHCKAEPWRVQNILPEGRAQLVELQTKLFLETHGQDQAGKLDILNRLTMETPVILNVTSKLDASKFQNAPEIEQLMSVGAMCQNMLIAAHAMGYVAQWLTGWRAYNDDIKTLLGHDSATHIIGFIHIGSTDASVTERPRPNYENIVSQWP